MNSKDVSALALAPVVRFFTYAAIKSLRIQNMSVQRQVIHSDMVPKFSEKVVMASLGEGQINHEAQIQEPKISSIQDLQVPIPAQSNLTQIPPKSIEPLQHPLSPVQMPLPIPIPTQDMSNMKPSSMEAPPMPELPKPLVQDVKPKPMGAPMPPTPPVPPAGPMQQILPPGGLIQEDLTQFYGKITQLLNDPTITSIECAGMGRPVAIIRRGQKEPTRIVLSEGDIRQVLEKVSNAAHIPLMEGVFRASVDNFSINAVVSEMIGSKFVIKKQPNIPLPPGGPGPMMPPRF